MFINKTVAELKYFAKITIMIGKTYKLTFTETSHQLANKLIGHGFNIRDILNAGVVLFEKSSLDNRGFAIAEAKTNRKQEFNDALNVILQTNTDLLNPKNAKLAQAIRNLYQSDCEQGEFAGEHIVDGAVNDAALKQLNKGHRTA